MKFKYYFGLFFLLGALICLVLQAPAVWLTSYIARLTKQQVRIVDVRGTIWQGSGVLQLTGGKGSDSVTTLPQRLSWQLSFNLLNKQLANKLQPNIAITIEQQCCLKQPLSLSVVPGFRQQNIYLNAFEWFVPADILSGLGAPWNTLKLRGSLQLQSKPWQLNFSKNKLTTNNSQADLLIHDLQSEVSTVKPLGSYKFNLVPEASGANLPNLNLAISTLKGALQLKGAGTIKSGSVRFKGDIYAQPGFEDGLNTLLTMLKSNRGAIQFNVLSSDNIPIPESN